MPGGPAEKAEIEAGDVITRFNGKDVRDSRQLKLSVAEAKPGQSVPVEVVRDGSSRPLRVTIGLISDNDFSPSRIELPMNRIPACYRA